MNTLSKDSIKEWGMSSLSESDGKDAQNKIGKMIYQAVLVRSLDILSEKEEKMLDELLDIDDTTPEDVLVFLQSKIPNFEKIVREERQKVKDNLVTV